MTAIPAAVIAAALVVLVGSWLGRLQNSQITRLWDEEKRLRGDPAPGRPFGPRPTGSTPLEPKRYWRAGRRRRSVHAQLPLGAPEPDHARKGMGPRREEPRGNQPPLL